MEEQKNNITEQKDDEVIDLRKVFKTLWKKKKVFIWVWIITAIVSAALIFPVPRYYFSEVKLAPEMDNSMSGGALGSIASSFGFDLGSVQTSDAIYPMLYPELFETNDFIVSLADIQIHTEDGEVNTDYFTYMKDHQKQTPYMVPIKWLKKQILSLIPKDKVSGEAGPGGKMNPYRLSDEQNSVVEVIRSNISCDVDIKTQMITISVKDQDRLVCALLADSIRVRLQNLITDYRTNKARVDVEHYEKLASQAKLDYERAMDVYGRYCDANRDVILQTAISKRDELESDAQLKYNTFTAMNTQLEAAKAKLQERTPAFTLLQGAAVPIKPAGPKRMIFIVAMLFLSTIAAILYIYRKEIANLLLGEEKEDKEKEDIG